MNQLAEEAGRPPHSLHSAASAYSDAQGHPAPHAPPPTDVKALVAGWITQRYREEGQAVAINATLLRQELKEAGIEVGRDRLYRVLDELTPEDKNGAPTGQFKRQRVDRVYRYEPVGQATFKFGITSKKGRNSPGTEQELGRNSPGTEQELGGAPTCEKHPRRANRSRREMTWWPSLQVWKCSARDPEGELGSDGERYCANTKPPLNGASCDAGVNVNPVTLNGNAKEDVNAGDVGVARGGYTDSLLRRYGVSSMDEYMELLDRRRSEQNRR